MKVILFEEPGDRYSLIHAVVHCLRKVSKGIKMHYSIFLITDNKNAWKIAETMGINGVMKKPCTKEEFFAKINE